MNKLVKGSIAGAAGIALLLGGAGTFALWNDSAQVVAGNLQTGELDITLIDGVPAGPATGVWEDISPEAPVNNTFDPATHKIVPGDTVTFTQDVAIKATGKNLKAQLSYDAGSIIINPALLGADTAPAATTDDAVTVSMSATAITAGDNGTIAGPAAGIYTITPATDGTVEYRVVITVHFKNATSGQTGQNLAAGVNLTGASFTLVQVRP